MVKGDEESIIQKGDCQPAVDSHLFQREFIRGDMDDNGKYDRVERIW